MLELVIGGARSGKSAYAQQCATEFCADKQKKISTVSYIATATADDAEMASRIQHHRQTRPQHWHTLEEPIALASTLTRANSDSDFIIVDCLTLWLTNLFALGEKQRTQQVDLLFTCLPEITTSVVFVTNEIGSGVVPMGEETRRFVDEAGWLHQRLATKCHRVTQVVAGIPNRIKNESTD